MNVETQILLRCPCCDKETEVPRVSTDYPDAVLVEVICPGCDVGDFGEVMQYDANGKHITRDPNLPNKEKNRMNKQEKEFLRQRRYWGCHCDRRGERCLTT